MKKTLFLVMLGCIGAAQAATVNLTLPGADDYLWVPGSNASGITTAPTAELVATLAGAIQNPAAFNTDLSGWFAGTGQGYDAKSTYAADVSVQEGGTFSIAKRPALSQEYMMLGVALSGGADSVTLNFSADNLIAYSLWAYDADTGTATELKGYTATTEKGGTTTYTGGTVSEAADYLFALWGSAAVDGGGGTKVTVSGIQLIVDSGGAYYWAPADATGNGAWAESVWKENNEGDAGALPGGAQDLIFDNAAHTAATVTLGGNVSAETMTLTQGVYTFTASAEAGITVNEQLLINGADATFEVDVTADSVLVESGALGGKTITIGDSSEDVFSVTGGSVSVATIAGKGKVQITGGEVEIKNGITASGGTSISGATLTGNTKLDGAGGSPLSLGTITVDADSVQLANATLSSPIVVQGGTLSFSGMMIVSNAAAFDATTAEAYSAADESGYLTVTDIYTVVTGDTAGLSSTASWLVGGKSGELKTDGKVYVENETDTTVYWVRGTTVADAAWEQTLADNATPTVQVDGGTLLLDQEYAAAAVLTGSGTLALGDNGVLHRDNVAAGAAALQLSGAGTYNTGGAYNLHAAGGVALAEDWAGVVNVGDIDDDAPVVLKGLANGNSDVVFGRVVAPSLQLEGADAPAGQASFNFLALGEGSSAIHADTVTIDHLYLGTADTAASLTVNGVLNLTQSTVYCEHQDSTLTAQRLDAGITSLNFVMDSRLLANATGENVLLTLTDPDADYVDIQLTLNGNAANERIAAEGSKHAYSLIWDEAQSAVILHAVTNPDYVLEKYSGATGNAAVGAQMLNAAFAGVDPQSSAAGSDLAKLLDAVDADALSHDGLAGAAGSSIASLGMALSGDVERQLRAIRNRTTTMGVNQSHAHPGLPYVNAWVNAEGNHAELDAEAQYPGYTLSSWGGTVGMDADLSKHLTVGLALTAMYGDFSTDGPDRMEGDLDTYYLSLFGRYTRSAWTHTFVAAVGMMDSTTERTVSHAEGSYTNHGDTDGTAFGFLYELGRVFALNDKRTACLQPVFNVAYRHVAVGGYHETGGNATLAAGDQTLDTVTFGLGARVQAEVGENLYNRASLFEARVLARLDAGDRCSAVDVAMLHAPAAGTVESAEVGAIGVEIGAGLTIPIGTDGAFFFDASAELRSGYSNFNGTLGYRINF